MSENALQIEQVLGINLPHEPNGHYRGTVVVAGAGPAGIESTDTLSSNGYRVIVIDKSPLPAGRGALGFDENGNEWGYGLSSYLHDPQRAGVMANALQVLSRPQVDYLPQTVLTPGLARELEDAGVFAFINATGQSHVNKLAQVDYGLRGVLTAKEYLEIANSLPDSPKPLQSVFERTGHRMDSSGQLGQIIDLGGGRVSAEDGVSAQQAILLGRELQKLGKISEDSVEAMAFLKQNSRNIRAIAAKFEVSVDTCIHLYQGPLNRMRLGKNEIDWKTASPEEISLAEKLNDAYRGGLEKRYLVEYRGNLSVRTVSENANGLLDVVVLDSKTGQQEPLSAGLLVIGVGFVSASLALPVQRQIDVGMAGKSGRGTIEQTQEDVREAFLGPLTDRKAKTRSGGLLESWNQLVSLTANTDRLDQIVAHRRAELRLDSLVDYYLKMAPANVVQRWLGEWIKSQDKAQVSKVKIQTA